MVTVKKKKKKETGHDETNLSFEESSVGLPIHLSLSKKIRNEIDIKLRKSQPFSQENVRQPLVVLSIDLNEMKTITKYMQSKIDS